MSVAQVVRSRPRPQAFTSIRRQLLRTRRMLLLQMASRTSHIVQETPTDILDQASCERLCVVEDLIQQRICAKLRQVEHALDRMLDASYGTCQRCRTDIPLPRLRAQPAATLCVACQGEREQRTLLRGDS